MVTEGVRLVVSTGADSAGAREALRAAGYVLREEASAEPGETSWAVLDAAVPARSLAQTLASLKVAYHATLFERLGELGEALGMLEHGDDGAYEHARSLAHRIRGTAGSYGYAAVSEEAGRVEDALIVRDSETLRPAYRLACEAHTASAPASVSPRSGPVREAANHLPLLVLTHDVELARSAQQLGVRCGASVTCAGEARAALELAPGEAGFAGALIDAELGAPNGGFRAAHMLRRFESTSSIPIAFVSSRDDLDRRLRAVHAGGTLFLRSPLDEAAFSSLVAVFESHRQRQGRSILLVDDDPDLARIVQAYLAPEGIRLFHLADPSRLLDVARDEAPDLILMDVQMAPIGGLDLCRALRSTPELRAIPIVFLTAHVGDDVRLACFEAGGDDYLAKPVLREELLARVRVRLERARLAAHTEADALTGLQTRRSALGAASATLSIAAAAGEETSLVVVDLDRLGEINDARGQIAGDDVLRRVGRHLLSRLRPTDLRARWGGDEFLLLLAETGAEAAIAIVERLLDEVRALCGVTFSAGIAVAPVDGADVDALARVATVRLGRAKRQGRARVVAV